MMANPRPLPFIPLAHGSLTHNHAPSMTTSSPFQQATNVDQKPVRADSAAPNLTQTNNSANNNKDGPITPPPDTAWNPSITVTAHVVPSASPPTLAQQFPFDPSDPVHAGLASRIATFYRQRSIQVAAQQQQRCREWAAAQRARCTELTQAGMLVVAWYVRDRIARRRRRARRRFRDCLAQLSAPCNPCGAGRGAGVGSSEAAAAAAVAGSRITRGERVRRWVLATPDANLKSPAETMAQTPGAADQDPDEVAFRMAIDAIDGEQQQQQMGKGNNDARLYAFADALIKRNAGRTSLPIFGELGFDEDSGSESDGGDMQMPWPARLGAGVGSQECDECDENEDGEDCDGDEDDEDDMAEERTADFTADGGKASAPGLVTPRTSS